MAGDEKTAGEGNAMSSGNNSSGSGQEDPKVKSSTPENAEGKLDPSSPGETGTTPGSNEVRK